MKYEIEDMMEEAKLEAKRRYDENEPDGDCQIKYVPYGIDGKSYYELVMAFDGTYSLGCASEQNQIFYMFSLVYSNAKKSTSE